MKKRILTLALALILIFSAVTMPASAATGKDVHKYLKEIAMEGYHDTESGCYYDGFFLDESSGLVFAVYYWESDQYIETTIFCGDYEVTWRISSNPSPAYNVYVKLYTGTTYPKGTVSLAANYNGAAYTSFKSFTGDTNYQSQMLELLNEWLPVVLEFTRAVINENDYTLKDLGLTGYNKCDYVHAYDHGTVTVKPTCVTSGTMTYTCRVCGATYSEELSPNGEHTWDEGTVVTPATCTEVGLLRHACILCGATGPEEPIPALGHDWDEGEIIEAPGCETEGMKLVTCTRCGETEEQTVPALWHAWNEGEISLEPNCTEDGVRLFTCDRCGETREEAIPNLGGHIWNEGEISLEPNCTEDGVRLFTCDRCGETREEAIPNLGGHIWTYTETLTENQETGHGTALYTCVRCSETKEDLRCAGLIFTDMPAEGNWAHDPIDWAYFNGITSGKTPSTFAPKDVVTRAEAVFFLWKAMGSPAPFAASNPFTDVKESSYYYNAVLWAVQNGITSGATDTTFAPKQKCTRAQIMMFLWAAAGKPEPETTENPFTDVPSNKYYYSAVLWAVENGITGGIAPDKFGPNNTCTRAQIVTFLYKAANLK